MGPDLNKPTLLDVSYEICNCKINVEERVDSVNCVADDYM